MNLSSIPTTPGVYQYFNAQGEILYIGKAINLKKRVSSYFQKTILSPKTRRMVAQIHTIKTIKTESEFEALLLEAKLINTIKPKYNVIWRDDKHPLYIKITKEEFPKIKTARRNDDQTSRYFGPFPSSRIVKDTLRFLREIFPYCSEKGIGKRACFYWHIGLCNPCPNQIVKLEGKSKKQEKQRYLHNIRMITQLLNGKAPAVIKQLRSSMVASAKETNFEQAARIKKQLDKLDYLRRPRTAVREYLQNPSLYDDVRAIEQKELAHYLNCPPINRIEGYDISNTQGTNATGSMVTFVNGEPDKQEYRRFKIKTKNSPDDPHMMNEMLTRRLNHDNWSFPDLIMVDGGKGQITAAMIALQQYELSIPVIGLAKRHEEIIIPQENGSYKTLRLPLTTPALQLLQRVRNEAHRFANAYHRKLRSKEMV